MNNILETDDQLLGYGELILNAHEIVDMIHVDQKDWLRRRQYLIEHQDRVLGERILEALKRGWTVSRFDRAMWSDFDRDWWQNAPEWVKSTYALYRKDDRGMLSPMKGYHIVSSCLLSRSEPEMPKP